MVDWTKVFELYGDEHLYTKYGDGSTELIIAVIFCVLTVLAVLLWSAIMAGLTVGLMSIDEFRLALIKETGSETEKKQVANVEYLLEDRHYLLVVILASNCVAMEALPLLMDRLMPKAAVVPVSVTFLLIFAEVIPQAVCLSDPLKYGSFFSSMLWALSWLLYIFAKPITILLEYCVEDPDGNVLFTRKEMHAVIDMHAASQSITVPEVNPLAIELGTLNLSGEKEAGKLSPKRRSPGKSPSPNEVVILDQDTATIMKGALKMKSKTVSCAYTPLSKVFMLAQDQVLDDDTISKLIDRGHSRIPVYAESKTHVVGIFLVKRLIGVNMHDPETAYKVGDFVDGLPLVFPSNLPLLEALNLFQTGHSHLAIVTNFPHEVIRSMKLEQPLSKDVSLKGIITLEDVIEELIQEEIEDEADREVHMLTFSYSRQLCDIKTYKAPICGAKENSFSDYDSLKELALACKTSPKLNALAWKASPRLNTLPSTDFQL